MSRSNGRSYALQRTITLLSGMNHITEEEVINKMRHDPHFHQGFQVIRDLIQKQLEQNESEDRVFTQNIGVPITDDILPMDDHKEEN